MQKAAAAKRPQFERVPQRTPPAGEYSEHVMPTDHPAQLNSPVPHIRYHSPYGSHPILRRKAADAYAAVVEFLTACTDWDGVWPDNTIQGLPAHHFITADDRNDVLIAEFVRTFGEPKPGISFSQIDVESTTLTPEGTAADWSVPAKLHDWAIRRVLAAPPAQRGWPDPLSCTCALDFRLRDPPKGALLPGQSGTGTQYDLQCIRSGLLLHVSSGNTSAFFDLVLPFAEPDAMFVRYVARIRPYLPIRLAKGNFRHYIPKSKGDGYLKRRVDAALLCRI